MLFHFLFILIFAPVVFGIDVLHTNFDTLKGSFIQKSIVDSEVVDIKKGVFFIKKPDLFRWDFGNNKKLFSYKKSLLVIDSNLEKAEHLVGGVEKLKFVFSLDLNNINEKFNIKLLKKTNHGLLYRFFPKSVKEEFDFVDVLVNGLVKKVTIYRGEGDFLEISFFNQVINKDINNNNFKFIIPNTYEVIKREL